MRGFVTASAVVGVLAVGGVPALGLGAASDHSTPGREKHATVTGHDGPPGPPPWAMGRAHGRDKGDQSGRREGRPDQAPGDGAKGPKKANHGAAMRDWAHCVAAAAKPRGDRFDPEAVCGDRPTPPGHRRR